MFLALSDVRQSEVRTNNITDYASEYHNRKFSELTWHSSHTQKASLQAVLLLIIIVAGIQQYPPFSHFRVEQFLVFAVDI